MQKITKQQMGAHVAPILLKNYLNLISSSLIQQNICL